MSLSKVSEKAFSKMVGSADPQATAGFETGGVIVDDALRHKVKSALAGTKFKGDIIGPEDAGYEKARTVWNAMVDKRPGLVLRCTCTDDVVAAVNVARAYGLHPSIRAGGHQVAGKALSDGGLTIDMTGMRTVTVDAEKRHVHVQGGCQLGDVDGEAAKYNLVVPAGIMSETGVPGLALGGGIGWFSRMYGLTCDNFVSLEVVLPSGEVIEVSDTQHPDLFWALKGGGGNFGVVTRFTFKAYSFGPNMRIGAALHDETTAAAAMKEYARMYPSLPRNVGWHIALKPIMPKLPFVPDELVGQRLVMFIAMWLEDSAAPEGVEWIEKLIAVGNPKVKAMRVMPWAAGVQRIINEDFADGHRYYTKEAHVDTLADGCVDRMVEFWKVMPMDGEIEILGLGGAIQDVPEEATAFANRQPALWLNFAMKWDDASKDAEYMEMTRQTVRELEPWTGRGVYVNMLNFDENDRIVEAYGGPEKYLKLGRIKAKYDPTNMFRINANIVPLTNEATS